MNTLDVLEAAALAKVHPDTMRRMMRSGEAPGAKIGRAWVVTEEQFQKWMEDKCRSTSAAPGGHGGLSSVDKFVSRLGRKIASKQKNSNSRSKTDSGAERSSETVVPFRGMRQQSDG